MVKLASFKIIWDKKAIQHFKDILTYLKKQSPQAPKIVKKTFFKRLILIKTNPLLCEEDKLKNPSNKDFRAFIIFSYRVTYQIKFDLKEIRILRIRHTSREPLGY